VAAVRHQVQQHQEFPVEAVQQGNPAMCAVLLQISVFPDPQERSLLVVQQQQT
jgi:hypothetical protein